METDISVPTDYKILKAHTALGLGTKIVYAGEDQQQFSSQAVNSDRKDNNDFVIKINRHIKKDTVDCKMSGACHTNRRVEKCLQTSWETKK
jgi:hypothetical protein